MTHSHLGTFVKMITCVNCGTSESSTNFEPCFDCIHAVARQSIVYYCSKQCKREHTVKHEGHCKLARLYVWVRDKSVTAMQNEENRESLVILAKDIPEDLVHEMSCYLDRVGVPARPRYLDGVISKMKTSSEYVTGFDLPKDEYAKQWWTRISPDMREKLNTQFEYEVPFNCRAVKEVVDMSGECRHEIEFFPQDFEVLSFRHYVLMFGHGKHQITDPWKHTGLCLRAGDDCEEAS